MLANHCVGLQLIFLLGILARVLICAADGIVSVLSSPINCCLVLCRVMERYPGNGKVMKVRKATPQAQQRTAGSGTQMACQRLSCWHPSCWVTMTATCRNFRFHTTAL